MNRDKIKKFSNVVRDKMEAEMVSIAAFYGITEKSIKEPEAIYEDSFILNGKVFDKTIKKQRNELVKRIKEMGYKQVIDEVTYTWFNRFMALKFMEMNEYIPTRVFSSIKDDKNEPDILSDAYSITFMDVDKNKIMNLRSSGDNEDLYKYLIISMCNYLNRIMPFLFENIEDYSELLFPRRLLHTDSIIHKINDIIEDEDWKEVEILGWIYQEYIEPRKNKVFSDLKRNIKVSKENIPAATQIFTPKFVVKYMVENSLSRLWLDSNPNKNLQSKWKYFIPNKYESDRKKIHDVEEIKLLDPAMGSGHILLYSFEVLYEIYLEIGYEKEMIAIKILNNNLFGLEIDHRATQIAGMSLIFKARSFDTALFEKFEMIKLNITTIEETHQKPPFDIDIYPNLANLWTQYINAKFFGSLIKNNSIENEKIVREYNELKSSGNIDIYEYINLIERLIFQHSIMDSKYDCVITNPPYMGLRKMNDILCNFIKKHYSISKSDLMTCFIEKSFFWLKKDSYLSMINFQSWLFKSTFESFRYKLITESTIINMLHFGRGIFGADFGTVAFVISNSFKQERYGIYRRLFTKGSIVDSIEKKEKWFFNPDFNKYIKNQDLFLDIPGQPIAYWINEDINNIFKNSFQLEYFADPRQGMKTSNNDRFIRHWFETEYQKIGFNIKSREESILSRRKWFPYDKGGDYRKWYGNNTLLLNWENDGEEIIKLASELYKTPTRTITAMEYYFREGLTWTSLSIGDFSIRYTEPGFLFDAKGSKLFLKEEYSNMQFVTLGFMNTNLVNYLLGILSPTVDYNVGSIKRLPIVYFNIEMNNIDHIVKENIEISKKDWDSRETSWDFKRNGLLNYIFSSSFEEAYQNYCKYWRELYYKLHENEEKLNSLFIDLYKLEGQLRPEVPLNKVTILTKEVSIKNNNIIFKNREIIEQFISYSIGCMFGRYSIDKKGLILANRNENIKDFISNFSYQSFLPDVDNIIPFLDEELFEDDIVGRFKEFLKITFNEEHFQENLDFIADAIGWTEKRSSEEVIRNYFLNSFYKHHCQMYKKRPIYWMFTSGKKKAFNALIYMHRYNKELLAKMRIDYLHKLQEKLEIKRSMIDIESLSGKEKTDAMKQIKDIDEKLEELKDYDEILKDKADQFIEIDLDDGVKVNYAKFEGLLEKI